MIETPRILTTVAQATAVIHIVTPRAKIREVMGPGHAELMAALAAQGVVPAGRWFTHHLKPPGELFDYELGVPVSAPVQPVGRVVNSALPAATVARTLYHGPYEGLAGAWGELDAWIAAQGRQPAASLSLWEVYVTDPALNPDPGSWRTELTRPLLS